MPLQISRRFINCDRRLFPLLMTCKSFSVNRRGLRIRSKINSVGLSVFTPLQHRDDLFK